MLRSRPVGALRRFTHKAVSRYVFLNSSSNNKHKKTICKLLPGAFSSHGLHRYTLVPWPYQ